MNRQTLANVLQDTNQTGSYTLATVLEGAETGSQLLLRDGNAVWQTRNAELLQRQLAVRLTVRRKVARQRFDLFVQFWHSVWWFSPVVILALLYRDFGAGAMLF